MSTPPSVFLNNPVTSLPSIRGGESRVAARGRGFGFSYFNHLSNHPKNVRCQRMPFCGFSTQWFSSGKMRSSAGMPRMRAALNAPKPWLAFMR